MAPVYERQTANSSQTFGSKKISWQSTLGFTAAAFAAQYLLGSGPVVNTEPSLGSCLEDVCAGRSDCFRVADDGVCDWAQPYNLGRSSVPAAVIRPKDAREVAGAVRCANKHGVKVQATAGSHSFGNHGLGGKDGALSVDLHHFQSVSFDQSDKMATIGGGTRLSHVEEQLSQHGQAVPHGVCGGIGMGGHATVGGMGPMSRMWGLTLDHVDEVEVVTANGTITRASNQYNSDLFFALRGAGGSFGIVTEFVMKTRAAPQQVLRHTYNFEFSRATELANIFHDWQALAVDPSLDRRLGTEFTLNPHGARISTTWYGAEDELRESGILDRLPTTSKMDSRQMAWTSSMEELAVEESMHSNDGPSQFLSKSLGFTKEDVLSRAELTKLFGLLERDPQETTSWSVKFTAAGGAVAEVPTAATAFAHRDKVMFYQSYAATGKKATKNLLDDFHRGVLNAIPGADEATYPGFVDPELRHAQQAYWGANLPALEEIKKTWDPKNVFHNPQSVRVKGL